MVAVFVLRTIANAYLPSSYLSIAFRWFFLCIKLHSIANGNGDERGNQRNVYIKEQNTKSRHCCLKEKVAKNRGKIRSFARTP